MKEYATNVLLSHVCTHPSHIHRHTYSGTVYGGLARGRSLRLASPSDDCGLDPLPRKLQALSSIVGIVK